jgi:hypothetical protein
MDIEECDRLVIAARFSRDDAMSQVVFLYAPANVICRFQSLITGQIPEADQKVSRVRPFLTRQRTRFKLFDEALYLIPRPVGDFNPAVDFAAHLSLLLGFILKRS